MKTPRLSEKDVLKLLKKNKIDLEVTPVVLLGIRGYYKNSMGVFGKNDRAIWDDALIWVSPKGIQAFQANTDPSGYRKGTGKGSSKGMAMLKAGVWLYKTGMHNGSTSHEAFRQYDEVTVIRDGIDGDYEDTGHLGVNIHRGGKISTSSLGCQTLPVQTWDAFKELGYSLIKEYKLKNFPYVLTEA